MNKFLVITAAAIVLFFVGLYVFIPSTIVVSKAIVIPGKREAIYRVLADSNYWIKENTAANDGVQVSFADRTYTGVTTKFTANNNVLDSSFLDIFALNADSVILSWEGRMPSPKNPVARLQQYWFAKAVKRSMDVNLAKFQTTLTSIEGLYGMAIQPARVIDSLLIFKLDSSNGYPQTDIIYKMVDQLKAYAIKQKANITNPPMLNISTKDSLTYYLKVALPVDKRLAGGEGIEHRWMLGGGNILFTEVKGGTKKIANAFDAIAKYASDFSRVAPAIPYQQLLTDRREVTDSSKWITRVYFPVM